MNYEYAFDSAPPWYQELNISNLLEAYTKTRYCDMRLRSVNKRILKKRRFYIFKFYYHQENSNSFKYKTYNLLFKIYINISWFFLLGGMR